MSPAPQVRLQYFCWTSLYKVRIYLHKNCTKFLTNFRCNSHYQGCWSTNGFSVFIFPASCHNIPLPLSHSVSILTVQTWVILVLIISFFRLSLFLSMWSKLFNKRINISHTTFFPVTWPQTICLKIHLV